jgi:hypothetical protein
VSFSPNDFAQRAVSRLKFPQLFGLFAALFFFDLLVPDFVPFVDEILFGLGTALFGLWREKVPTRGPAEPAKPPTKNVTPPGS